MTSDLPACAHARTHTHTNTPGMESFGFSQAAASAAVQRGEKVRGVYGKEAMPSRDINFSVCVFRCVAA